jgi:hypothetical protein
LLVWWQSRAILRRGVFSSLLAGALLVVLGAGACLGPWDVVQDTRAGMYLFSGIVMWRWGKDLKAARVTA